jgi:hypothetical protein
MKKNLKVKIPKWLAERSLKMYLTGSGQISMGNVNYDEASGDSGTPTLVTDIETSEISLKDASGAWSYESEVEGTTSRADLLAAPYALSEFYAYSYNSCLVAGTNINMADGTTKFVEDLEEGDELLSAELPGMGKVYNDYRIYDLDKVKIVSTKVKQVVFDFSKRYYHINDKLKGTRHPTMVFRNDYYEWWQMSDLLVNDKLLTTDLSLDEVISMEEVWEEVETVGIKVDKYHTYFAEGYLVHD